MSNASECDICGLFFKPEKKATISMDVHVANDAEGGCITWSNVDLCSTCSGKVLAIVKPALNDFDAE